MKAAIRGLNKVRRTSYQLRMAPFRPLKLQLNQRSQRAENMGLDGLWISDIEAFEIANLFHRSMKLLNPPMVVMPVLERRVSERL